MRYQLSSCQPERSSPARWATLPWCIAYLAWRTLGNSLTAWSAEPPNLASCAEGHSEVALGPKTNRKRQKVTGLDTFQLLHLQTGERDSGMTLSEQMETASKFWYSCRIIVYLLESSYSKWITQHTIKAAILIQTQYCSQQCKSLFSFVRENNRNRQIDT